MVGIYARLPEGIEFGLPEHAVFLPKDKGLVGILPAAWKTGFRPDVQKWLDENQIHATYDVAYVRQVENEDAIYVYRDGEAAVNIAVFDNDEDAILFKIRWCS